MRNRLSAIGILLVATFSLMAEPSASVLVYYMPKTLLAFDIEYTLTEEEPGIFYQYSQRYLGTTEMITQSSSTYELTDVSLRRHTIADTERSYAVDLTATNNRHVMLALDSKGILEGINIRPTEKPVRKGKEQPHEPYKKEMPATVPFLEEQMMAGSVAKMAEMTAKQIYRLRETRLNILAGDVEHAPADGKAMETVLQELDKQEQALTELFVGKRTVKHLRQQTVFTPEKALTNHVLFRFSQHAGVVAADDLSGEPVYMNLTTQHRVIEPIQNDEKKPAALSAFYYNQPGSAGVSLIYQGRELLNRQVTVAQFGVAQALPQNLLDKGGCKIYFDTKTGAIKSIQK